MVHMKFCIPAGASCSAHSSARAGQGGCYRAAHATVARSGEGAAQQHERHSARHWPQVWTETLPCIEAHVPIDLPTHQILTMSALIVIATGSPRLKRWDTSARRWRLSTMMFSARRRSMQCLQPLSRWDACCSRLSALVVASQFDTVADTESQGHLVRSYVDTLQCSSVGHAKKRAGQ